MVLLIWSEVWIELKSPRECSRMMAAIQEVLKLVTAILLIKPSKLAIKEGKVRRPELM
jgi:hypothetical protein